MSGHFKKGEDNRRNKAGRPPGSPNKSTEEIRKAFQLFVENNWQEVTEIWGRLDDRDKLAFFERMLKHVMPPPLQDITQFSEGDIDLLLTAIKDRQSRKLNFTSNEQNGQN